MARIPTAQDLTLAGLTASCTVAANAIITMSLPIWGPFVDDTNFLKSRFTRESQQLIDSSVYIGVVAFGGSILASSVKGPVLGL